MIKTITLAFLSVLFFQSVKADVWPTQQQWNDHYEKKFSEWVKKDFNQEIFYTQGPYREIPTDCADASYGMRMIFAYENKLPFVIRNITDSRRFISNEISKFDHIEDPLQRFRAFMDWVMDITDTGTLTIDTYPVAINREQIQPGIIYLANRTHSYQVVDLSENGITTLQSSTTPRAVRTLSRINTFPHYVPGTIKNKKNADGFRKFKNPDQYSKADSTLPGFSLEQFEKSIEVGGMPPEFYDWVVQKLQLVPESLSDKTYRYMVALCYVTWDRAEAIYDAQNLLRKTGGRCMNATDYDQHSTPGRDKKLKAYFEQLFNLVNHPEWKKIQSRYKNHVELILGTKAMDPSIEEDLIKLCDVNRQVGGPGRPMSLAEVFNLLKAGRLVSDPNASLAERWGLANYAPRCPQY
jgi:hypothetical protein